MGCGQSNDHNESAAEEKYVSHKRRMRVAGGANAPAGGGDGETGSMIAEVTSECSHLPGDEDEDWISFLGSEYEADRLIEQCRERRRRKLAGRGEDPKDDVDGASNEEGGKGSKEKSAAQQAQELDKQNLHIVRWTDTVTACAFGTYLLDEHERKSRRRKSGGQLTTGKNGGGPNLFHLDVKNDNSESGFVDSTGPQPSQGVATQDGSLMDESGHLTAPLPVQRGSSFTNTKSSMGAADESSSGNQRPSALDIKSPGSVNVEDGDRSEISNNSHPHSPYRGGAASQRGGEGGAANNQNGMGPVLINPHEDGPTLESSNLDHHALVLGVCKAVSVSKLGILSSKQRQAQQQLPGKSASDSTTTPGNPDSNLSTPLGIQHQQSGLNSFLYESVTEKLPAHMQGKDPFEVITASPQKGATPPADGAVAATTEKQQQQQQQPSTDQAPATHGSRSPEAGGVESFLPNQEAASENSAGDSREETLLESLAAGTGVKLNPKDLDPANRRALLDEDGEHLLTTHGLIRWEQEVDRAIVRCIVEKKGAGAVSAVDPSELEDAGVEDYQIFRSIYSIHNPLLLKSPCCQCPHPLGTLDGVTQWVHLLVFSIALQCPEGGAATNGGGSLPPVPSVPPTPLHGGAPQPITDSSSNTASVASHASSMSSYRNAHTGKLLIKNPKSQAELQSYLSRIPPVEKATYFAKSLYHQTSSSK